MKNDLFLSSFLLLASLYLTGQENHPGKIEKHFSKTNSGFIENKGQVNDQFNQARPDVLFSGVENGMVFHLRKKGVSYQFYKIDTSNISRSQYLKEKNPVSTIHRVDINWVDCNPFPNIEPSGVMPGFENFYYDVCPNGVHEVKSYSQIFYSNIYEGINLRWYKENGNLEYDFELDAGADYSLIKFELKGLEKISINTHGDLVLQTPIGTLVQQSPVVRQNGKILKSRWLVDDDVASFQIENIDTKQKYVIDPVVRGWGTYYGDTGNDATRGCTTDANGNVYITGSAASNAGVSIATAGSHQTTYGGGSYDAYLAKFNSNGIRLWATHYGGSDIDEGRTCIVDVNGNVFVTGYTASSTGSVIATPGSHQPSYGGGAQDAFLVKFNSSGIRLWGTYYGGTGNDQSFTCLVDSNGNVYIAGNTDSPSGTVIATPGCYQPNNAGLNDQFLVKFDANGVRQWGTFFGGAGSETGSPGAIDGNGNIYLTGQTTSSVGTEIATPGSHQPNAGGLADGFLAKFNSNGARIWGTYYGGAGTDMGWRCAVDSNDDVYLTGQTSSSVGAIIATPGSHQPVYLGGNTDGFLAKFSSNGVRQWSTYYGDAATDYGFVCFLDSTNNVFMAGASTSTGTLIASPGCYQTLNAGGNDAYLVKFNSSGQRQWATFYGDLTSDIAYTGASDGQGNAYIAGQTNLNSGTVLATANSQQTISAGGVDGFLVKFADCILGNPINVTPASNQTLCSNSAATLLATGNGTINWFASPTSTSVLGTGTVFTTSTLTAGTYTFYADDYTCIPSFTRAPITVTVLAGPSVTIIGDATICIGSSATLTATGANTYTWNNNSMSSTIVASPTVNTTYSVAGTSSVTGCTGSGVINVIVSPCTEIPNFAMKFNSVNVLPNPNDGKFILEMANMESEKSLEIYDIMGNCIYKSQTKQDKLLLNISEFVSGIYFIKIQASDGAMIKKFIKL